MAEPEGSNVTSKPRKATPSTTPTVRHRTSSDRPRITLNTGPPSPTHAPCTFLFAGRHIVRARALPVQDLMQLRAVVPGHDPVVLVPRLPGGPPGAPGPRPRRDPRAIPPRGLAGAVHGGGRGQCRRCGRPLGLGGVRRWGRHCGGGRGGLRVTRAQPLGSEGIEGQRGCHGEGVRGRRRRCQGLLRGQRRAMPGAQGVVHAVHAA